MDQLPTQFLERLQQIIPPENLTAVVNSFSTTKPTTIRVNTLKTNKDIIARLLTDNHIDFDRESGNDNVFYLKNFSAKKLSELSAYKQGLFYVQNYSSMLPAYVLDPKPGEKILDLCAAPGSKTTLIANLMGNQGLIVANDLSHVRLLKLQANLKTQGVTIANTIQLDAKDLWTMYPARFDKVLVDVPCSLEGKIYMPVPKTYGDWSLDRINKFSELQKQILQSAYKACKPAGIIVYSTCTLAPEENEAIIDWALKNIQGIELMDITIDNVEKYPIVQSWQNQKFDQEVNKAVRILPNERLEGFFIAKIRKNK